MNSSSSQPKPAIAYLTSQYPKISESFVIREILGLKQRGFRVGVASMNRPDRAGAELTKEEQEETDLTFYVKAAGPVVALRSAVGCLINKPGKVISAIGMALKMGRGEPVRTFKNFMYLAEALIISRWMQKEGYTHAHGQLGSSAVTVGLFVKHLGDCSFSFTVHGPFEFYDARGEYLAEKIAIADSVVCISHFARSQMMKLSPYEHWHKLDIVRLGVDPDVFLPTQADEKSDSFELICVGRLTPAKGQHILIDALKRLIGDGRKVQLRVVGDGEDRDSLHAHVKQCGIQDAVIFEGAVNQERIRELYARADAFVIPSFAEGIPVVLMESMSMGIPCITTRITGIPELITDGENGLLTTPSDIEALAAAVSRLMDDPALQEKLKIAGRERILEAYNLPLNLDKLAENFIQRTAS